MPEYIEREVAMEVIANVSFYLNPLCLKEQRKKIKAIPTADVVEVVRCKDCIFLNKKQMICTHNANSVFGQGKTTFSECYCNYGVSRNET